MFERSSVTSRLVSLGRASTGFYVCAFNCVGEHLWCRTYSVAFPVADGHLSVYTSGEIVVNLRWLHALLCFVSCF